MGGSGFPHLQAIRGPQVRGYLSGVSQIRVILKQKSRFLVRLEAADCQRGKVGPEAGEVVRI